MSKVSFDKELVADLCRQYDISPPSYGREDKEMTFYGLPVLPFLMDVAQLHGLSPDMLEVVHEQDVGGCPTCGPGSCEFIVREA